MQYNTSEVSLGKHYLWGNSKEILENCYGVLFFTSTESKKKQRDCALRQDSQKMGNTQGQFPSGGRSSSASQSSWDMDTWTGACFVCIFNEQNNPFASLLQSSWLKSVRLFNQNYSRNFLPRLTPILFKWRCGWEHYSLFKCPEAHMVLHTQLAHMEPIFSVNVPVPPWKMANQTGQK